MVTPGPPPYTKGERWGSCLAHGGILFIGLPLTALLHGFPLSLLPCPVVAYLISRSFRRRARSWGAFQGMQASALQLLTLLLASAAVLLAPLPQVALLFGTAGFLLFLYSLWGALDTFLGFDFHYLYLGNLMERVSRANLGRPERRRRRFGGRGPDGARRGE